MTTGGIYENPKYYDIAFSFRDIPQEVDVFEKAIKKYSKIQVTNVVELGCGTSPHLGELLSRGYVYHGIDLSFSMLEFAREKVSKEDLERVHLYKEDMTAFHLPTKIDFCFIMLGSLYVQNRSELYNHFEAVADVLKPGGLYFLDWCINFSPIAEYEDSWVMEKEGVTVETQVKGQYINKVEQLLEEKIKLIASENQSKKTFSETKKKRMIFPQEFLILLDYLDSFEFIGWWNNWDFTQELPGKKTIERPITIIRKK